MTFPAFELSAAVFINDYAIHCMYVWLVLFLLPHKMGELNRPPVPRIRQAVDLCRSVHNLDYGLTARLASVTSAHAQGKAGLAK